MHVPGQVHYMWGITLNWLRQGARASTGTATVQDAVACRGGVAG